MGIHAAYPPSPDVLARLDKSADRAVITQKLLTGRATRGRGAQSNRGGRFEPFERIAFDDGWELEDEGVRTDTRVHEERAKTIISRNTSPDIDFDRSINPYRGCEHGCPYCYARPTHGYLGLGAGLDFEREIFAKVNAAERLRAELGRKRYSVRPIAIGTNTDPYQPVEKSKAIMRAVLEVLAAAKHPVMITTKSALIVRDLDILSEMAKSNLVHVSVSVTSLDARLSRKLEPRAATPARRLAAIERLALAGVPVSVLAAPMIPAINDMELERILAAGASQGATSANFIVLRLPGEVKDLFREWLLAHYPNRVSHVMGLVRDMRGGRDNDPRFGTRMRGEGPYAFSLKRRFELCVARLGLGERPPPLRSDLFKAPEPVEAQLQLF
ncbi:MAG: PA0069 family radical SAM protein [Alphaproteobacteria bacterium]|nr:PA0069 family radical SAM protein [Alphaproteobacteria bacterium]